MGALRKHPRATAGPAAMLARQGLFTVKEAAEVIGRTPRTLRRWIQSGRIQVRTVLVGDGQRVHVFDADELRDLNEFAKSMGPGRPPVGLTPMRRKQ